MYQVHGRIVRLELAGRRPQRGAEEICGCID